MREPEVGQGTSPTIAIRTTPPGVTLEVHGRLDDRGVALLTEVARAALVAVGRAHLIRVDLRRASVPSRLPRVLRQLKRAGAAIVLDESTPPANGSALTSSGSSGRAS